MFDVTVLGAGAAGLMAAIESGRRSRRTLVLDHAERPGKKILISGGGRSNFTNLHTTPQNFLSNNPHFAKSALARFTPADMVALIERHKIPYHEKTLGQLFCDRSAHDLLNLLLKECAEASVALRTNTTIQTVTHDGTHFHLATTTGQIRTKSLIIATGGLSIPKMGATGLGYQIAGQFGHKIVQTRPGLVPLTFSPADLQSWSDLAGLSTEVIAQTRPTKRTRTPNPTFREKLLITHRGLSGPAVLQISSYWPPGDPLAFDLAPDQTVLPNLPRRDAAALAQTIRRILPTRLADRWTALNTPQSWTNASLAALEAQLHAWPITPSGTEGYAKAEVTVGGVDTTQLDSTTMESKLVPNLYFIGEVVDVTGWLGGYNFQWAWASGASAGQSA
jgi:predicted Rossmann fold flavoprotein